jgi:hypothetical protein
MHGERIKLKGERNGVWVQEDWDDCHKTNYNIQPFARQICNTISSVQTLQKKTSMSFFHENY